MELYERHRDQGLVLIGIHTTGSRDRMPAYVEEHGIGYPVAIDVDEKTVAAFAVDSYPDYYVIDRAGKLRFADLANDELDRAIETLLAEPVPGDLAAAAGDEAGGEEEEVAVDAARVLADALAEAHRSQRRVLVHLGAPW